MKAAVFDTYVRRKEKGIMHFDIIVPEDTKFDKVQAFGKEYLSGKGETGQPLTSKECRFCHIEEANATLELAFEQKGYFILEMQGCE